MTGETAGVLSDSLHLSHISDTAIAMSQTHPPPASYSVLYTIHLYLLTENKLKTGFRSKKKVRRRKEILEVTD